MRTNRIVLGAVLALGLLAAGCTDDGSTVASGTQTPSPVEPTSSGPTSAASETPTESEPPIPPPAIEEGRHFVFVRRTNGTSLTFDLAEFYSGEEANEIAGERGDEVPVPNDVYIVNDNPKLRTVAVATDATVKVYDWTRCCDDHTRIGFDEFARYVAEPTDEFHGTSSPYWIRVRDDEIVAIAEQYLP
jgi:hypothetical protein